MPTIITDTDFPNLAVCLSKGVVISSTSDIISLILPISVSFPIAITTPMPVPALTVVLEKAILILSPNMVSRGKAPTFFSEGTDSPVKGDSSIFKLSTLNKRKSAGTLSPGLNKTMSPTVK